MKRTWWTTGAIAAYCGVDRSTVLRWIQSGQLVASLTPGRHHRVRAEDLRKFLVSLRIPVDGRFFD